MHVDVHFVRYLGWCFPLSGKMYITVTSVATYCVPWSLRKPTEDCSLSQHLWTRNDCSSKWNLNSKTCLQTILKYKKAVKILHLLSWQKLALWQYSWRFLVNRKGSGPLCMQSCTPPILYPAEDVWIRLDRCAMCGTVHIIQYHRSHSHNRWMLVKITRWLAI